MARVIVDVMLKPEILDPQGQAIARALPRLGFSGSRRYGRASGSRWSSTAPPTRPHLRTSERWRGTLLANTVIEDYTVTVDA